MSGFVRFFLGKVSTFFNTPEKFLRFSQVLAVGHSALYDLILIDPGSLGPSVLCLLNRLSDVKF
jgi:hypothetical protein